MGGSGVSVGGSVQQHGGHSACAHALGGRAGRARAPALAAGAALRATRAKNIRATCAQV